MMGEALALVPLRSMARFARKEERKKKKEEWWAGHPHSFRYALTFFDECKYDVQFTRFLSPLDEGRCRQRRQRGRSLQSSANVSPACGGRVVVFTKFVGIWLPLSLANARQLPSQGEPLKGC